MLFRIPLCAVALDTREGAIRLEIMGVLEAAAAVCLSSAGQATDAIVVYI